MRGFRLGIVLIGCLSCGQDLPERTWSSEHVRYFSRSDDTSVCPAILTLLEDHARSISTAIGIEIGAVSYYKFNGLDDFGRNSPCEDAVGCAGGASVYSPASFDRHELIHAYMIQFGLPPWLLVEGTAVALSCQRHPRPTGTWQSAFEAHRRAPELYGAGGWLVGHLLRTYGAESFVRLYSSVPNDADTETFATMFADIYSVSLNDAWTAATSGPDVPLFCPWECGRPGFALDVGPIAITPTCGAGTEQLTFAVPMQQTTRWIIDGDARFSIRSCQGRDEPGVAVSGSSGPAGLLAPLQEGRYFIDVAVEPDGTPTISGASDGAGLHASTCEAALPVPEDLWGLSSTAIFYGGGEGEQFSLLSTGTARRGSLSSTTETVSLCSGCDLASCETVRPEAPLMIDGIGAGAILRVPAGPGTTLRFHWF